MKSIAIAIVWNIELNQPRFYYRGDMNKIIRWTELRRLMPYTKKSIIFDGRSANTVVQDRGITTLVDEVVYLGRQWFRARHQDNAQAYFPGRVEWRRLLVLTCYCDSRLRSNGAVQLSAVFYRSDVSDSSPSNNDAPDGHKHRAWSIGGSRRVCFVAEPNDQGTGAEISRRSPRSADPGSYNWKPWTPPPGGLVSAGDAFGRLKPASRQSPPHHC